MRCALYGHRRCAQQGSVHARWREGPAKELLDTLHPSSSTTRWMCEPRMALPLVRTLMMGLTAIWETTPARVVPFGVDDRLGAWALMHAVKTR